MRFVTQKSFGGPEVLEVAEGEAPRPLPTEVLIEVRAAGVNPVDAWIRSGRFPLFDRPPILGYDIAGVVVEVVPGVNRFRVGDEVYGMPLFPRAPGGYAERVAAPSRQLALKPRTVDFAHAAALPLAGLTAWQALVDVARIEPGARVLVHGGGGGVGHLAVQIAKARGAWVAATASAEKHGFVRELGADLAIDHRTEDFVERARDIDVVLELVGGQTAERSILALRPGGLLVTAVDRTNAALAAKTEQAGRRFAGIIVEPDGRQLEELAVLVDAGRLRVHVEATWPLARAADAHRRLASSPGITGKLALTVP